MTKRNGVGAVYLIIVIMTLLLRVSGAVGVYEALGVDNNVFFTLVVQLLCFGALPLILYFVFICKNQPFLCAAREIGVKKIGARNWLRTAVIAVCMIYTASMVSYIWQNLLSLTGYVRVSSPTEYNGIGDLFIQIALVAVLPGVFEEITHRGLLFAGYRETGWRYVLVSALLFSLMHQNITQTGYTFYDGIILALLMYYTGSVFPGIFVHFFNNLISVLQEYGQTAGGFFSFISEASDWFFGSLAGIMTYVALGAVLLAVTVILFMRMRKDAVLRGLIPSEPFWKGEASVLPLRRDAFYIATIAIGAAATVFSLVWGIMR